MTRSSLLLSSCCLMLLLALLPACEAKECEQMTRCCAAVQGVEGMGEEACGPLAAETTTPSSCLSVTSAVRYMLEDRGEAVPTACQAGGQR